MGEIRFRQQNSARVVGVRDTEFGSQGRLRGLVRCCRSSPVDSHGRGVGMHRGRSPAQANIPAHMAETVAAGGQQAQSHSGEERIAQKLPGLLFG